MHSSADLENGVPALASIAGMNMKPIPEEPVQSDHLATPEAGTADDSASAASSMEVTDRIASLEQRVQMQEDELQLLKSALADVVRRLNISEEQQAMQNRKGPTKARPLMPTLPLRPVVNNGTVLPKKTSGSLPSPSGARKDTSSPANKSTVKRAGSTERVGPMRRESPGDPKSSRTRTGSTSSNSSGKKTSESKPKDPVFSAGKRRVTHCKVTVQIFLSHPSKRIGSSESRSRLFGVLAKPVDPESGSTSDRPPAQPGFRKAPSFTQPFPQSPSQTLFSPLDMSRSPSFRSPLRSPSQYFQICF